LTPESAISEDERRLLLAIQDGLPIVERPYEAVAQQLGTTEERVIAALASLLKRGIIKRLGAIPNHYALGITANGMAVWDVPDDRVGVLGRRLAQRPEVTHCYQRPRRLPQWRYNLYAMVHGRARTEVIEAVDAMAAEIGLSQFPHDLLFSARQVRKKGARLQESATQPADESP
jgi:DNA-binding Lrp family transcriptional regulator